MSRAVLRGSVHLIANAVQLQQDCQPVRPTQCRRDRASRAPYPREDSVDWLQARRQIAGLRVWHWHVIKGEQFFYKKEKRVLAQHINEAIGIDLSEDMVGVYNAQAQDQVSDTLQQRLQGRWPVYHRALWTYPNKMQGSSRQAYQGNLADPTDTSPAPFEDAKFFDFDVAGVGLGFHHFDKPDLASKRLAERLKPGGVLFVIDFVAHKIDPEDAAKRGIAHHGFSEEQIKNMFDDAGLTDFVYQELPEPITFNDPMGHGHGHGHGHGSGTGHNGDQMGDKHEHAEEHGHGHGQNKSHSMTKQVFIARASKPQ
ncbi:hypothetical protein NW766_004078 [Fusarium irregulare]|uniref:Methyltransferase n=1 Tax=Fusarium irregulare TaxID=2494466 RepID=A0A9W8UAZ0_9HYPO|nr:hypothetical protein NW766_004078 [Fusarium irregulare]